MNEQLMTTNELIELLKVTRQTLTNWRKQGMPFLKGPKSVRFNKADVLKWLHEK